MVKLSYSEQLKHPNWQRKRLEILERDGFQCVCCDAKEKTLHVHHKTYIKGRMAWDYEEGNLESLCEDCHEKAHDRKTKMDEVLAQYPSDMWGLLTALLVGYGEEYVDPAFWCDVPSEFARAGQLAWFAINFREKDLLEVVDICKQIGPFRMLDALRAEVGQDFIALREATV